MLFMTFFNAYQMNHTWCEQNEPLKNNHRICLLETRKSNTLSVVMLIRNFTIRTERKIILGKKIEPCFSSLNSVSALLRAYLCSWMKSNGLEGWEKWPFTFFGRYMFNHWKTLLYRNKKRMIDYIAETICLFSVNSALTIGFLDPCYLIMSQSEWTHRKVSFTEQKIDWNIIYHKLELSGCFLWRFSMLTKWITLGVNRTNHWKTIIEFFVGNGKFKHFIGGNVDMKLYN